MDAANFYFFMSDNVCWDIYVFIQLFKFHNEASLMQMVWKAFSGFSNTAFANKEW